MRPWLALVVVIALALLMVHFWLRPRAPETPVAPAVTPEAAKGFKSGNGQPPAPTVRATGALGVNPTVSSEPAVHGPTDRVQALEIALPRMATRLAEVTAGDSPVVWRTVSNLTLAGHQGWIERHRGLTDAEIRALEGRDIASSTVFTEEGAPYRDLLVEWGAPLEELDHWHRRVMEIADTYHRLGPDPVVGTDPLAPAEFQPYLEADRAQHHLWSEELRRDYLEVIQVELSGSIPEPARFLNRLLILDPPPRIPPLGY